MDQRLTVEEHIVRALRQIARAMDLHSRSLLQKFGLTAPQLSALREIERLQPVTAGILAARMHLGAATLTGVLDRLEERGLACRARDAGDRRNVVLRLTPAGAELFASAPPALANSFTRRLHELPDWELTNILSTLQRVAGMMGPCLEDAGSVVETEAAGGDDEPGGE
jgi:DNA-binding MarR family transcriptional regulator